MHRKNQDFCAKPPNNLVLHFNCIHIHGKILTYDSIITQETIKGYLLLKQHLAKITDNGAIKIGILKQAWFELFFLVVKRKCSIPIA